MLRTGTLVPLTSSEDAVATNLHGNAASELKWQRPARIPKSHLDIPASVAATAKWSRWEKSFPRARPAELLPSGFLFQRQKRSNPGILRQKNKKGVRFSEPLP
jgi:hypothetical protein